MSSTRPARGSPPHSHPRTHFLKPYCVLNASLGSLPNMPMARGEDPNPTMHTHLLRNHVAASSNCQSNVGFNPRALATFGASMSFKSKAGKAHAASTASTTQTLNTSSALLDFNPRLLSQLCFVAWMQVSTPPFFCLPPKLTIPSARRRFSPPGRGSLC